MSTIKVAPKIKISQILEKKKREDPIGLIKAQKNGTMAEFLADDLRAAGINPAAVVFGGNPSLNVGGAKNISQNLQTGLKDESKPVEVVNNTIAHAQAVEAPKCPSCSKNVFLMTAIKFLDKEWHKTCFICGLGNSIGCKRQLIKGEYETHADIAYCKACYAHNFQLGAARGAVLNIPEATKGTNSVSETANMYKFTSINPPAAPAQAQAQPIVKHTTKSRASIETTKCVLCSKSVYKVEEISVLGSAWHKSCFKCGGTTTQGCKRVLTPDGYEQHNDQPFCKACFARLFKHGAARGAKLSYDSSHMNSDLPMKSHDEATAAPAPAPVHVPLTAATTNENKSLHPLKSYQNMNVSVTELTSSYTEAASASASAPQSVDSEDEPQGLDKRERLKSYMNMNVNIKELKSTYGASASGGNTHHSAADTKKTSSAADKFRAPIGGAIKCIVCSKSVYTVEEVTALGSTWHKSCFKCGGTGGQGCKRVLTKDGYTQQAGHPYCNTCSTRMAKLLAARGTIAAPIGVSSPPQAAVETATTTTTTATAGDDTADADAVDVEPEVSAQQAVQSSATQSDTTKPDTSSSNNNSFQSYTNTYEKPRVSNSTADKFKAAQAHANKCPCCTKTVYKAEELFANGSYWHQMCFTCGGREGHGCKRRLNATSFQLHTGEPYCKTCFDRLVKAAMAQAGGRDATATSTSTDAAVIVPTLTAANAIDINISEAPAMSEAPVSGRNSGRISDRPSADGSEGMSLAERSAAFKATTAAGNSHDNKPRTSNSNADKFKAAQAHANKCPCCTKTVYKAEELFANGSYWHQMCFTCGGREGHGCKRRLNATSFQLHTGEPYCKTCFDRLVKAAMANVSAPVSARPSDAAELESPAKAAAGAHWTNSASSKSANQSADSAREQRLSNKVELPKCKQCALNVYKAEELIAMDSTWHKQCFCCGGLNGSDGCQRMLSTDGYEVKNSIPYCYSCYLAASKQVEAEVEHEAPTENEYITPAVEADESDVNVNESESEHAAVAASTSAVADEAADCMAAGRESFDLNEIEYEVRNSIVTLPDNDDYGITEPGAEGSSNSQGEEYGQYGISRDTAGLTALQLQEAVAFELNEGELSGAEPAEEVPPNESYSYSHTAEATTTEQPPVDTTDEAYTGEITEPAAQQQVNEAFVPETGEQYTDVEFNGHMYRGYHLSYESDFDENGVVYWIGTNHKTDSFMNPHMTDEIIVTMSSTYKGKPLNIVSRSIAGAPNYTENSLNSWVMIDLGENRLLLADHYSLKHGGSSSGNAIRNWILQAKADNIETEEGWVTLMEHKDDNSISGDADSSATWELEIPEEISASTIGFRYFRIVQNGPNSNKNNCLFCCGIELYGVLFERFD